MTIRVGFWSKPWGATEDCRDMRSQDPLAMLTLEQYVGGTEGGGTARYVDDEGMNPGTQGEGRLT